MSLLKVSEITDLTGAGSTQIPGHVVQVVQAVKTDAATIASATFTPVSGLSVDITPKSSSSKILVSVLIEASFNSSLDDRAAWFDLLRNGNSIIPTLSPGSRNNSFSTISRQQARAMIPLSFQILDSPSSTSLLTYSVNTRVVVTSDGDIIYINRSRTDSNDGSYTRGVSSITVMEIAQ